ncbi:MAG TPA: chemotaxis protein CheB [Burkholderiales bacterium]|nr:chemotaxis protein CheB [Burkholderiales bacterium]
MRVAALAASAGGLSAIRAVLAGLPAQPPFPLVVVQHIDRHHRSLVAEILARQVPVDVREAADGELLAAGVAYIAPADRHLLVEPDARLRLTRTELVHFVRPSADLLFESVATAFRERAVAVVLSGTGVDGAMGVKAIKKMGGTVIVQDEATCQFPGMVQAALATGAVDLTLPLGEIAPALLRLCPPE